MESILAKLPKWSTDRRRVHEEPYDINSLDTELVRKDELDRKAARVRFYTIVGFGFVSLLALLSVALLWWLYKRRERRGMSLSSLGERLIQQNRPASFQPDSNSTGVHEKA